MTTMKIKPDKIVTCLLLILTMLTIADLPITEAQSKRDLMVVNDDGEEEYQKNRLAIVIGVNHYFKARSLEYAVADARMIKETLESQGNFKVKYYADDMKESKARLPYKDTIMKAIKGAVKGSKQGYIKTFVIYFSGHGFEIDGKHYLATPYTDPDKNMIRESAIDLDEVLKLLQEIKKKSKVIFFLDACRNDPTGKKSLSEESAWDIDEQESRGIAILKSTSEGDYSYEMEGLGHGVYTYHLNEGLKGKADSNGDGYVSYDELREYVWFSMDEYFGDHPDLPSQTPTSFSYDRYGKFFITRSENGERVSEPKELRGVKYRDMVRVNGGTFTQEGIHRFWEDNLLKESYDDGFRHTISSFEIGKYEVTYELWYAVYQWAIKNGYHFANSGMEGSVTGGGDYPDFNNVGKRPTSSKYEPVTMVNWRDSVVWCNAYSEMLGYTPVYESNGYVLKDSRDSNGDNCDNVSVDWYSNGYRLPTEGEWQYAATSRGNTPWNYASGASDDWTNDSACDRVAWFGNWYYNNESKSWEQDPTKGNSDGKTHFVGGKSPNGLGIYDMSGNVWEWCWDWYGSYPGNSRNDYRGSSAGSYRVLRGGSWRGNFCNLQGGCRADSFPYYELDNLGFRLARSVQEDKIEAPAGGYSNV